jgi:UPF0716 family protein affecting phage T7 exclusion
MLHEFWNTLWHTHTPGMIAARIGLCLLIPVAWAVGNEVVVALWGRHGRKGA